MIPLILMISALDLATFLLVIPIVGTQYEVGVIGRIYAEWGPIGAALYKALGTLFICGCILVFQHYNHPRYARVTGGVAIGAFSFGAIFNLWAIYQVTM